MTVIATACAPDSTVDLGITDARPIAYGTIRDASGVLGYAESLLGPDIATRYQVAVGPGASAVEPAAVAGAWELPLGAQTEELATTLRSRGSVTRIRDQRDGQIWIADFQPTGGRALRLLFINGTHRAFERNAAPEVRPGPHVYLIAYRKP